MAGAASNIVVGLDIGTSGVAVAVIDAGSGAKHKLLGVGFSPAAGIDRGMVIRAEDAVTSIKGAITQAEFSAGVKISHVYAGVDMPGMIAGRAGAVLKLDHRRRVTRREICQAHRDLCTAVLPDGYTAVQLAGVRYYINGEPVARPLGARGRELKVQACVLGAPGGQVKELQRCLCEAGLKVKQTVAGPLAVAEAVLTGAERELGVVCVDIGAGLTRVAYINHGQLEEMEIFPVGSGHITSDLAVGLHTTLQAAEKIKNQYGLRHIDGQVGVPALSSPGENNIPGSVVAEIIKLRIEEILDFIKRYINKLQITDSLPGGIVITGGGSRLTGLPEMAGAVLGMPVRVGTGRVQVENIPEEEAYRYVSAIGLGLRGSAQELPASRVRRKTEGGILRRLKTWL